MIYLHVRRVERYVDPLHEASKGNGSRLGQQRGLDELAEARRTEDASEAAQIVEELIETFSAAPVQAAAPCDRN